MNELLISYDDSLRAIPASRFVSRNNWIYIHFNF
jgi:hypothetical protein